MVRHCRPYVSPHAPPLHGSLTPPIVQIRDLWSVFRNGGVETLIHKDLNLDIAQGELLSIVGGSGSGKTVLLRQILGLETPMRGSITVLWFFRTDDPALARQVVRGGLEGGHLVGDAARAVGITEMGHQRDLVDLRQRVQPRPGLAEGRRREAQAVHAAVHLEEHPVRRVGLVARQPVDLLVAMHRMPQVQARAQLQVARLEHTFEQQDRATPAQGTHALGLGQVQQGEAVGAAQALEGALDAMAVGIGLDHRPDAGVTGLYGEFENLENNGVQINTNGVAMIMRAPLNKHMDQVTVTWKYVGGFVARPDGASLGVGRYKRVAMLQSGGGPL